ncbi:MAG: universal stress protein [Synergistales bacterium]|nr:universal stress protein [Synergistales bacterium]
MDIRKALVPLDSSRMAFELVRFAFQYALNDRLDWIDFFHVWDKKGLGCLDPANEKTVVNEETFRRDFACLVEKALQGSGHLDIPHDLIITYGIPCEEIINRAEKEDYQVIIIGSQGASNIEKFFIGHVTAKVVRHAPCTVLIFRPGKEKVS